MNTFSGLIFDNVHDDAVAYMFDPPASWAKIDDCGNFPCTGPNNAVIKFDTVTCTGTAQPSFCATTAVAFTVVTKRLSDTTSYTDCVFNTNWNAYLCTGVTSTKIGQLIFESLDNDTWDRSV